MPRYVPQTPFIVFVACNVSIFIFFIFFLFSSVWFTDILVLVLTLSLAAEICQYLHQGWHLCSFHSVVGVLSSHWIILLSDSRFPLWIFVRERTAAVSRCIHSCPCHCRHLQLQVITPTRAHSLTVCLRLMTCLRDERNNACYSSMHYCLIGTVLYCTCGIICNLI